MFTLKFIIKCVGGGDNPQPQRRYLAMGREQGTGNLCGFTNLNEGFGVCLHH